MHDKTSHQCHPFKTPGHEPWGPLPGLDPVQEYRVLAHELQECFPNAVPQQLDQMIAREMAFYGGHSLEVIIQVMGEASLHLASAPTEQAQDYVRHTVTEALRQGPPDDTVLGWGV